MHVCVYRVKCYGTLAWEKISSKYEFIISVLVLAESLGNPAVRFHASKPKLGEDAQPS